MSLLTTFKQMPRAGQWTTLALVGLVAYFAVIEPTVEKIGKLGGRAESRRAELVAFEKEQQTGDNARSRVALGVSRYGEVLWPGDPESREAAFNRKIAEVLSRHGIKDQRATTRSSSLSKGPLLEAMGQGAAVSRQISDLQFEATPEQVSGIVADLERTPEVAAVSRVQLRRVDEQDRARLLRANISVETWVQTRAGVEP